MVIHKVHNSLAIALWGNITQDNLLGIAGFAPKMKTLKLLCISRQIGIPK